MQPDECPSKRTDTKKQVYSESHVTTEEGLLPSNQSQLSGKNKNSQSPEQQENTFLLFKSPSPLLFVTAALVYCYCCLEKSTK